MFGDRTRYNCIHHLRGQITFAAGQALSGKRWRRPNDTLSVAVPFRELCLSFGKTGAISVRIFPFLPVIGGVIAVEENSKVGLESRRRWEASTRAKEVMLKRTHIPEAPWGMIEAVDKKRARLLACVCTVIRFVHQRLDGRDAEKRRMHPPLQIVRARGSMHEVCRLT
jgi:hypothetical protein